MILQKSLKSQHFLTSFEVQAEKLEKKKEKKKTMFISKINGGLLSKKI